MPESGCCISPPQRCVSRVPVAHQLVVPDTTTFKASLPLWQLLHTLVLLTPFRDITMCSWG